jgi:hypothetical protein
LSAWNSKIYGPDVIISLLDKYGDISEYVSTATRIRGACGSSISLLAGALFWMAKIDRRKMEEFAEKLATGSALSIGDPELALRNRMIKESHSKSRLPRHEYAALIATSVLAKLRGKQMKTLWWNSDSPFPVITSK